MTSKTYQPAYLQNTAKAACGTHTVTAGTKVTFEVTIQESFVSRKTGKPCKVRQAWLLTIPGLYNQQEFETIYDVQNAITAYKKLRASQQLDQELAPARAVDQRRKELQEAEERLLQIQRDTEAADANLEEYEELLEQSDSGTSRSYYRNQLQRWRKDRQELAKRRNAVQAHIEHLTRLVAEAEARHQAAA